MGTNGKRSNGWSWMALMRCRNKKKLSIGVCTCDRKKPSASNLKGDGVNKVKSVISLIKGGQIGKLTNLIVCIHISIHRKKV